MKIQRRAFVSARWVGCLVLALTVVSLGLLPSVLAQGPGETTLYQEDFDSGRAPGWELEPGWHVIQDEGNTVLAGEGHQWARPGSDRSYPGDFRVQFRLKLVRGRIHLVYRFNNTGRYFIGFEERGSDLNKQYWPDTFQNGLVGSGVWHGLGVWHQVEITGQKGRIRLFVDGQKEWDYTDPDPLLYGSFAFETLDNSVAYVDDIAVFGPVPAVNVNWTWVRTGGPLGGLGYDIRMRPDNPDIMYVTDAWAGVFMSTDGGQTWSPKNEGITTRTGESGDAIPVFCLTIDPHNYDTLWIGTQNVRGIFKSTDGGATWTEMDNGVVEKSGITFRGFAADPRSSDVVYAAAELSSWAWSGQEHPGREFDMTKGVVYQTTDGGQHWTAIWRGDNLARYVWIDPRDSNVIYVSTGIFDREAANSVPDARRPGGVGIVKSVDGGQTWSAITNGLNNLYVGTLFLHPTNPDILLAGTGNNQYYDHNGVYRSTDGGESWRKVLGGENIESVEISLSNPEIAYAASADAIYRSSDGGQSWQRVSGGAEGWGPPGIRAGFPIDLQVDPRDPNRIFANNYGGGNFLSTDGGRTWTAASAGYTGAQVRDITVDPAAPGRVFAAARSGIFASSDGGSTWSGLNYPPQAAMEWYVVALDPTAPQHVLAANNWSGVLLQSTDRGQNWVPVSRRPGEQIAWRAIAFAPSDPSTVYAGTSAFYSAGTFDPQMLAGGIYVSHNGGSSWAPANDERFADANVSELAIAPDSSQIVYAATGNYGLLKTTDGGLSWTLLPLTNVTSPRAMSVAIHPTDPNAVYVGLRQAGLYRSTDGGATWQFSGAGMNPEASVSSIVLDPTNPLILYAADTFSGVYRSEDGGTTWMAINTGLRMRSVNALSISSDGQHLYAATEGEGVFRLDLNGQPPESAPE